ncbi:hypothetical protein JCM8097_005641 [Rhodosporidiobolus ruineniae]
MESPYPPQLPLPPSAAASSSSSTNPSPASVGSNNATSAEPRQSRKRTLSGECDECEQVPEREEEEGGDEGDDETSGRSARPRGIEAARLNARRSEGARRAAARAVMARSASEGGEAMAMNGGGGPGEDERGSFKRRRVDDGVAATEAQIESARSSGKKASATPRPVPLSLVPTSLAPLPARSPLLPSSVVNGASPSLPRPPKTPSTSRPPPPSPTRPPSSASATLAPFAYSSPATSSATPLSPQTPSRPRNRRRANSLPAFSSPRAASSPSYFHPFSPSRSSPYPNFSHVQPVRKQKVHDSRARQRTRLQPSPIITDSSASTSSWTSVAQPMSQAELLSLHALRLASEAQISPASLTPPALVPPITKTTLRELDMQEIMRNPQLRHDVVFDPNLMFRPNYDGERGERKRLAAEQYWLAINREVSLGCRCTTYQNTALLPCICLAQSSSSGAPVPTPLSARLASRIIPLVLELRNILLTLLPAPGPPSPILPSSPTFTSLYAPPSPTPSSPVSPTAFTHARDRILDALDPSYISQQLARGMLDVASLAKFLGQTLKTHCAPMRDTLVDEMVKACEGEGLASGLRQCFEILELMKLDIANHQLRSLRAYLVQTSVDFERRFIQDFVIRKGGVPSVSRLKEWLDAATAAEAEPRTGSEVDDMVVRGLLDLVFPSSSSTPASAADAPSTAATALPDTLQLDSYRLQAFHADATDLSVLYLLLTLFQQLAYPARPSAAELETVRKELWCIMLSSTRTASTLFGPAAAIPGIPQGPPGQGSSKLSSPTWRTAMQDVLLQLAARAQQLRDSARTGKDGSSAPSSSFPSAPDAKTLSLVQSYFDTNVRPESKLFQLLQSRLRTTLETVVVDELAKDKLAGPLSFASWWTPPVEPVSMTAGAAYPVRGAAASAAGAVKPEASMMASPAPVKRSLKRSVDSDDDEGASSDEEGVKRRRCGQPAPSASTIPSSASAVDAALARNGLTPLATEVRLLGSRIAKVASFNLTVYRGFYEAILRLPIPPSSPPL